MLHYRQLLQKNKGFSLTELLVAISISVMLLVSLYSVYILSYKSYQRSINRAELNQNARISLERITRDLRQTNLVITELPPTDTDPLNPAPSSIVFQDGHDTTKINYIEYSLQDGELYRKVIHYYFTTNPDIYVAYNIKDNYGNPPLEAIDENVVKADKVQSLEFFGSNIINIKITVANLNESITYQTQTLGRNTR